MIGIVKVALHRPLTFIVMAILIAIVGILSAARTPVDMFPNIRIPVIAVGATDRTPRSCPRTPRSPTARAPGPCSSP